MTGSLSQTNVSHLSETCAASYCNRIKKQNIFNSEPTINEQNHLCHLWHDKIHTSIYLDSTHCVFLSNWNTGFKL